MPERPFSFGKKYKIRKTKEYHAVYQKRKILRNHILKIYYAPNQLPYTRMGMAIRKRTGKAYLRNRIKRLFREAFRLSRPQLPKGLDIILVPNFSKGNIPHLQLIQHSLLQLLKQTHHKS
ncbi:MAG: ribonuclease P protein component [Planctomycetota bacterium]|nr:MAG: ribonuclease P protein component [Planctomycetota bacterium]